MLALGTVRFHDGGKHNALIANSGNVIVTISRLTKQ